VFVPTHNPAATTKADDCGAARFNEKASPERLFATRAGAIFSLPETRDKHHACSSLNEVL